jgi:hypothetical protein
LGGRSCTTDTIGPATAIAFVRFEDRFPINFDDPAVISEGDPLNAMPPSLTFTVFSERRMMIRSAHSRIQVRKFVLRHF